jgi:2-oxo-3-hexenedioate decarboxylase
MNTRPNVSDAGPTPLDAIADEAFGALGSGKQVQPFSSRYPSLTLGDAYKIAAEVHERRIARGERPIGRKFGFTNRTIWDEYGVHAPILGYMYDTTVRDLEQTGTLALASFAEPRIEPEIIFGLSAAPSPEMTVPALLGCIEWVAHGFEIVQSIFPGWKFTGPDTVAAFGLHGALLIGPRQPIETNETEWLGSLSRFELDLLRNGEVVDRGSAVNVLDGPLCALLHVVRLLAEQRTQPPLAAGEIVTTGTVTRAFPVKPGEAWSSRLREIALPGAQIRFG